MVEWITGLREVHSSMSPKGVEHEKMVEKMDGMMSCIHQCRRKALSTMVPPSNGILRRRAFINVAERR